MAITIVRLGQPRSVNEGLRLGTVRRPPRGVPKTEFARQNWYDVWYPTLAPSPDLVKQALAATSDKSWSVFVKQFRAELAVPDVSRSLDVLAALSRQTDFSVGCYCQDEARCHRSVLRTVFLEKGADVR